MKQIMFLLGKFYRHIVHRYFTFHLPNNSSLFGGGASSFNGIGVGASGASLAGSAAGS